MPGPIDSDLVLRAASVGNLTGDSTLTKTIRGGIPHTSPLGVSVLVPQSGGAGDTLVVTAKFTDTGKKIEVTHTDTIDDATTYPFLLHLPLPATLAESLEVVLNTTDAGGGVNFGAVVVWLERASHAKVNA